MKTNIRQLAARYPIDDIEVASVQLFINNSGTGILRNQFISEILNKESENIYRIKKDIQPPRSLHELATLFELLIPSDDRKLNGAFFTPRIITNFMANELIFSEGLSICDPSCGCGAFLIACAARLREVYKKPYHLIFKENIYGVDIMEYSVRRCKILLSLLAILDGDDQERFDFNIISNDSLNADWNQLFAERKKFDVIIGNPPYVKYQDLPIQLRKDLYHNWSTLRKGTYNLYFAFFELGLSLLRKGGRLGYIVPNNYFTSLAAIDLRRYLQISRTIDKIIDFNHLMVFDVQTYTCITFLTKESEGRNHFLYERVKERRLLNSLANLKYSKVFYEDLNVKKWRLLRESDKKNIKRIENQPRRLGDITDIHVGIATLKDNIYFVDGSNISNGYFTKYYHGQTFRIEEQITKPIVKISDFENEQSLRQNTRRIIFPYIVEHEEPRLIPEDELKEKYSQCYKYLIAARQELVTRDKGRLTYPWYAYARSQGLAYYGEKLLTPTFSRRPRFLYDEQEEALFCNGYGIYEKKAKYSLFDQNLDLKVLQKILNSQVMSYYVSQTSYTIAGGYSCYQKNFIELFGIPDFTANEIELLKTESRQPKIDAFLIEKYKLESLELEAIEPSAVNVE